MKNIYIKIGITLCALAIGFYFGGVWAGIVCGITFYLGIKNKNKQLQDEN